MPPSQRPHLDLLPDFYNGPVPDYAETPFRSTLFLLRCLEGECVVAVVWVREHVVMEVTAELRWLDPARSHDPKDADGSGFFVGPYCRLWITEKEFVSCSIRTDDEHDYFSIEIEFDRFKIGLVDHEGGVPMSAVDIGWPGDTPEWPMKSD